MQNEAQTEARLFSWNSTPPPRLKGRNIPEIALVNKHGRSAKAVFLYDRKQVLES